MTVYAIAGAARKELDALQNALFYRVQHRVIEGRGRFGVSAPKLPIEVPLGYFWTAERAGDYYLDYTKRMIALMRREVDPDSFVRIACKFCKKEYAIKRDVYEFACNCRPDTQSAIIQRLALA